MEMASEVSSGVDQPEVKNAYRAEEMHDTALASLSGEFAEIIDASTAIAELAAT
jgi:hypothetical protein